MKKDIEFIPILAIICFIIVIIFTILEFVGVIKTYQVLTKQEAHKMIDECEEVRYHTIDRNAPFIKLK